MQRGPHPLGRTLTRRPHPTTHAALEDAARLAFLAKQSEHAGAMPASPALESLVALLLILSPRAQQDPSRGVFAGWVRDSSGKRVAGADVVLLSRPLPG